MSAAMGALAQFGMAASGNATELYELVSGDIALQEELFNSAGITGSRSHPSERTRQNTRRVSGSITLNPNSVELDNLLPRILGGTESLDSFPLAETIPTFSCQVDRVTKVFSYSGCVVSRATFRASQGGPLELQLDIEGVDETVGAAGSFPSLSLSQIGPYIFSDAAITVGGSSYSFRDIEITIDNAVDTERFFNSQTRASIPARDRVVQWTLNGPYGDNSALYSLAVAGVACVATFTNGNRSLSFNSTKVQFPRLSPTLQGKEEIFLPLVGIARRDNTTDEIQTTNDSTG